MSQFSLICAIEAGRLEAQTLMMLTTLKRFGGALRSSRIVAFQGRSGEKISTMTRKALADMDVEYVFRPDLNQAPWFNYTNKIAAVAYAQAYFETPWCVWLDSDMLFLDTPSFVKTPPPDDVFFQARFEYLPPAVTRQDNTYVDYWQRVFSLCGADFEKTDFFHLELPERHMKPFFNSGLFMWRQQTNFAETYTSNYYRLLKARIAPKGLGPWIADQVTLSPTIEALQLRWAMLAAEDHLMVFPGALKREDFQAAVERSNVVHYSKSRNAPHRQIFDPLVIARHPDLAEILQSFDAFSDQEPGRFITHARRYARRLRQEIFVRACVEL